MSVYALLKLHLCQQMELVYLAIDQIIGIKEIDYAKHVLKDSYMIIKDLFVYALKEATLILTFKNVLLVSHP